jgi:hypothetical protein
MNINNIHNNPIFIHNNLNNGISAMPQKESTSDGNSSFEMGRKIYMNTVTNNNNQQCKKWIGGNRDASQVTSNRKNTSIGKGTSDAILSFKTYKNENTVKDALIRCRSGGACAPPKKNARTTNAPTPRYAPMAACCNDGIFPVLYH